MRVLPWFSEKIVWAADPTQPNPVRGAGFERLIPISETAQNTYYDSVHYTDMKQPIEKRSSLASDTLPSTPYLTSAVSNRSHHVTRSVPW